MTVTLHQGDCIEVMRAMPDNSVDSIVTDPPYELGFMGKSWDSTGIANSVTMWTEALRVLKPGGHLLAFSGSRTYHRMVCAIEDAGFEVRDQMMWIYSSGFPKSLDVSKAIDKAAGAEREVIGHDAAKAAQQTSATATAAYGDFSGIVGFKMKPGARRLDAGSAARFFYCAKASKEDRNEGCESIPAKQYSHDGRETSIDNAYQRNSSNSSNSSNSHPTVKPTDLMAYLCRLVTPPGGTVLDPFMGSGSTGKAAVLEGFNFIGIDLLPEYVAIARARIDHAQRQGHQPSLLEAA